MKVEEEEHLIESSRLLSMSSDDDSNENVPEMNISRPPPQQQSCAPNAGKIKRKIRLKRRDRNSRFNHNHFHGEVSLRNHYHSDYRDCSDCCCLATSPIGPRKMHFPSPPCTAVFLVVFVVIVAGLLSLTYFAVALQNRMSAMSLKLEAVIEDKKFSTNDFREMATDMGSLRSNQTVLLDNLSKLVDEVKLLSDKLELLNKSVSIAQESLASGPSSVFQIQNEVAALGSRLTTLQTDLSSVSDQVANLSSQQLKKTEPSSFTDHHETRASEKSLLERLQNVTLNATSRIDHLEMSFDEMSSKVSDQIKGENDRTSKAWELLEELQDNIQNVSAKAMSCELVCKSCQKNLKQLQQRWDRQNEVDIRQNMSTSPDFSLSTEGPQ